MLLFFSGTLLPLQFYVKNEKEKIEQQTKQSGNTAFAVLGQSQKKWSFHTTRYFFSYSGNYYGKTFETTQEVTDGFYASHREGQNVEVYIYIVKDRIYTTLRHGAARSNSDMLIHFTKGVCITGLILLIGGFLIRL